MMGDAMIKPKYDPRLDRLARLLDRDEESPHGWRYRAREADSFGPGHLLVMWRTDDMTANPDEIEIKQTAWGVCIALRRADDDKLIYLVRIPFHLIVVRLEVYARKGAVPKSFDEFAAFIGLRFGRETTHAN